MSPPPPVPPQHFNTALNYHHSPLNTNVYNFADRPCHSPLPMMAPVMPPATFTSATQDSQIDMFERAMDLKCLREKNIKLVDENQLPPSVLSLERLTALGGGQQNAYEKDQGLGGKNWTPPHSTNNASPQYHRSRANKWNQTKARTPKKSSLTPARKTEAVNTLGQPNHKAYSSKINPQELEQPERQMFHMLPTLTYENQLPQVTKDGKLEFKNNTSLPRLPPPESFEKLIKSKRRRKKGSKKSGVFNCGFCRKNNINNPSFQTHPLKDEEFRVLCPMLRAYICPICLARGDNAHTLKYCPYAVKPWFIMKITLSHWSSLPLSVQIRLTKLANETGIKSIEPIYPNTKLDYLSRSRLHMNMTVSNAVTLLRKGYFHFYPVPQRKQPTENLAPRHPENSYNETYGNMNFDVSPNSNENSTINPTLLSRVNGNNVQSNGMTMHLNTNLNNQGQFLPPIATGVNMNNQGQFLPPIATDINMNNQVQFLPPVTTDINMNNQGQTLPPLTMDINMNNQGQSLPPPAMDINMNNQGQYLPPLPTEMNMNSNINMNMHSNLIPNLHMNMNPATNPNIPININPDTRPIFHMDMNNSTNVNNLAYQNPTQSYTPPSNMTQTTQFPQNPLVLTQGYKFTREKILETTAAIGSAIFPPIINNTGYGYQTVPEPVTYQENHRNFAQSEAINHMPVKSYKHVDGSHKYNYNKKHDVTLTNKPRKEITKFKSIPSHFNTNSVKGHKFHTSTTTIQTKPEKLEKPIEKLDTVSDINGKKTSERNDKIKAVTSKGFSKTTNTNKIIPKSNSKSLHREYRCVQITRGGPSKKTKFKHSTNPEVTKEKDELGELTAESSEADLKNTPVYKSTSSTVSKINTKREDEKKSRDYNTNVDKTKNQQSEAKPRVPTYSEIITRNTNNKSNCLKNTKLPDATKSQSFQNSKISKNEKIENSGKLKSERDTVRSNAVSNKPTEDSKLEIAQSEAPKPKIPTYSDIIMRNNPMNKNNTTVEGVKKPIVNSQKKLEDKTINPAREGTNNPKERLNDSKKTCQVRPIGLKTYTNPNRNRSLRNERSVNDNQRTDGHLKKNGRKNHIRYSERC
ncbi:DgyrCDS9254 [Dimorphilus gyrociliatus]|uniref:DgyrCDS9254 n=1 Tax=Dimorphilus gyrociliatus TaxID=2664684 RepID=A0A7I8VYW2_9ANNE|nr:DgyrCDS9254 [Dimorphilus gyrociliatus]